MNKLVKKLTKDKHHLLLAVLLTIFIVLDISVPVPIANLVDTIVGKTFVILMYFHLLHLNKLSWCFSYIAGYMLIMRSMNVMVTINLDI